VEICRENFSMGTNLRNESVFYVYITKREKFAFLPKIKTTPFQGISCQTFVFYSTFLQKPAVNFSTTLDLYFSFHVNKLFSDIICGLLCFFYLSVKVTTVYTAANLHKIKINSLLKRIMRTFCAPLRVKKNFSVHFSACSNSVDSA
jgi:hypothetical protein